MATRTFPFVPGTTAELHVGDLAAVPRERRTMGLPSGHRTPAEREWVAHDTRGRCPPWVGDNPPTSHDVVGLVVAKQGLTRMEIFTQGGLEVVGTALVMAHGFPSHFGGDFEVGTVHQVWGWKAAIEIVAEFG